MLFLPIPSNHRVWSRFNFQLRLAHFLNVVEEMVNMIIAQRAYEVNSRAVRVADDMLQQVNNLVR